MTRFVLGAGRDSLIVSKEKLAAYENLRAAAVDVADRVKPPNQPELVALDAALNELGRLDGKQP